MRPQANQIYFVLFSVIEYLAIGLALAYSMLDGAPKMRFRGSGLLQTVSGLVIRSLAPEWIPGDLRVIYREGRQHMQ
jgi:hypothetical protein